MNPETVTTSQLLGSFTAKHWRATIITLGVFLSAISSTAFLTGQYLAEAKASAEIAELKGEIALAQSNLTITKSSFDNCLSTYNEWRSAHKACEITIQNKDAQISELSGKLATANNCTFIHKQIEDTIEEINNVGIRSVFSEAPEEKRSAQTIALEARLRGYQEKLGTCNQ